MNLPLLQMDAQIITLGGSSFEFPEIKINKGDLTGLVGLAGSGKSILLRILSGLIETPFPAVFQGENTGFIFNQNGVLRHHSLVDNIVMPIWFNKTNRSSEHIQKCLEKWNLTDIQENFMSSLSPQVVKLTQYARCDLLNPDIIFIERPHKGLTTIQQKLVNTWVEEYTSQGGAIVYTDQSHHIFQSLKPRVIKLGGGNQRLRTIINLG